MNMQIDKQCDPSVSPHVIVVKWVPKDEEQSSCSAGVVTS